jgi:DNA uptake protein ComE-like DNA-binding protein
MALYSRRQLLLILLLAGAAGAGLAIDHWRRARPELAERLETLDRSTARPPLVARPGASSTAEADRAPRAAFRRPHREPPPQPIDVNAATEAELTQLPGVSPALASRIVAARPFAAIDDLARVRGLRRATLERLRPFVTVASTEP